MNKLYEYVVKHCVRGACTCGKCIDAGKNPKKSQPSGHTVDLTFFKVSCDASAEPDEFLKLVQECFPQWLDGQEHNYLEVGADIGNQGVALMTIGLGDLLGVWLAMSPDTMMPFLDIETRKMMAGQGMVALKIKGD